MQLKEKSGKKKTGLKVHMKSGCLAVFLVFVN
jgi:hypothetical protein